MKKFSRLLATVTTVAIASSAVTATAAENQPFTKTVSGYTVNSKPGDLECVITPTQAVKEQTMMLGNTMWPDANAAIESLGLSWSAQYAEKINAARKAGHLKSDVEITTPLAAIEAINVLAAGKGTADALKILESIPFVGGFLGGGLASKSLDAILGIIRTFAPDMMLMLPGELASAWVNPTVDASTPFVPADGQSFSYDEAEKLAKQFKNEAAKPVYTQEGRLLSTEARTQAKKLSDAYKQAWTTYNLDAAKALEACLPSTTETAPEEPTNPDTVSPKQDTPDPDKSPQLPNVEPGNNGNGNGNSNGNQTNPGKDADSSSTSSNSNSDSSSIKDASSQVDAADKASSLVGNEGGASKTVDTVIGVGVGLGAFLLLGFLLAALPWLKPVLPPQIAKLIP
ncbi:hypothetical protein CPHO_07630 [Corynebacterium phocae]|uniref:Uncharacterized protein n=1 Tax=Corynebacterium phocae TaxID=161895 RepID=A0A1L7D441_9CORY|nr:hypothetical protein [Corynebacterium phocae]APT92781.1 hypothetical protein CPHO_07630 [Corynebacterium phocae]KAA8723094.1 hypothetical protein F4V58_07135 [Corynebacterium phocae]